MNNNNLPNYRWINDYQLFLFDFDGLLVNTEEIQYLAYKRMCSKRGFEFPFNFQEYCHLAHYESDAFRERLFHHLPELKVQEPIWDILYKEKKANVIDLLNEGAVQLMPGVEDFLNALYNANINSAVVTNSPDESVNILKAQHSILNTFKHWITRKYYTHPKPHPESYLVAIELLSKPGDQIIGFEDSPRGLRALMETESKTCDDL